MGSLLDDLDTMILVDIEAAGPIPSLYAMLSIGACTLTQPRKTFYVELIPDKDLSDPQAQAVHGLDINILKETGLPPAEALGRFSDWLDTVLPEGRRPLLVAFNAPFDWMFLQDYFLRYLGKNPFGHSAIDIKAFYQGASGKSWEETSGRYLHPLYNQGKKLSHNALGDAIDQAVVFEGIIKDFFMPDLDSE